jgi:thiol-disulfide isomerase/thioredoxin
MTTLQYIGATWCGPCKTVKPVVATLAHKFTVPVTYLDYDEMEEDVDKAAVKKLPTIRILEEGKVVVEITTNHADTLELWLRKHVRVNGDEEF